MPQYEDQNIEQKNLKKKYCALPLAYAFTDKIL